MNRDQPHVDNYRSWVMVTWGFILLFYFRLYLNIGFIIKSEVEREATEKI